MDGIVSKMYNHRHGLTIYTLTSVDAYSPYCFLYISSRGDKENLFNNQKLL